jgi:transcriptional regulator with GAF, ATPase, and Fis domain
VARDEPVPIIGISKAIEEVLRLVDMVAASDCCVLIEGESGVGKELVARRLHAKSKRANAPFIPVNCAGISETLFESQFFGHVRGAFTGAEQTMLGLVRSADNGTLLMDEVGEIPQNLQPKLLRVLQDGEVMPVGLPTPIKVNTRFVAATNRNLREDVRENRFREDLYHRLNIVRVCIPPLRERQEDVPVLLDYFLARFSRITGRQEAEVPAAVRNRLAEYPWPGNVRELAAWVERLYATGLSPELLLTSLLADAAPSPSVRQDDAEGVCSLQQAEQSAILRAMEAAGNNQREAARLLQVHRSTLARKLKDYCLV